MGVGFVVSIIVVVIALTIYFRRNHKPPTIEPVADEPWRLPADRTQTLVESHFQRSKPPKPSFDIDGAKPVTAATFDIVYDDGAGDPTRRRIELHSLTDFDGKVYIEAWCHLRRADRSFRVDRIREMVSVSTRENIARPSEYIAAFRRTHFAPGRDFQSVIAKARPGLLPLIWIARSDNELSDREMDILVDYVASRVDLLRKTEQPSEWNPVIARRWIENARPTLDEARGAIARMSRDGREVDLCRACAAKLIVCSGHTDERAAKRADRLGLNGAAK